MALNRRIFAQFCAGLLLFPVGFANKRTVKDPPYTSFDVPLIKDIPFQIFTLFSKDRTFYIYVKQDDNSCCWVYFDKLHDTKPVFIRLIKISGELEAKIQNLIDMDKEKEISDILVFNNKDDKHCVLVILKKKEG